MGEYTQVTFALSRGIGLAPQRRTQQTLMTRERTLRLPTLPIHTLIPAAPAFLAKTPHHLTPVTTLGPFPPVVAPVQRDYRRTHAQVLPAIAMALLAIERRVTEHSVVSDHQRSLGHDGAKLRCIVAGTKADPRCGEEVAGCIAGDGQFRPQPAVVLAAGALEEVAGGVPALHAGGVDGCRRLGVDQALFLGALGGADQQGDKVPLFNSRLAA